MYDYWRPPKIKGTAKQERVKSQPEAVERYRNVCRSHLGTTFDLTSDAVADKRQNNRNICWRFTPISDT